MRVAIHRNDQIFKHSTSWSYPWEEYCKTHEIDYDIVNCFEYGILEKLQRYDCLFWHFSNYSLQEMIFARSILKSVENLGLSVFPDAPTSWHFDDKVAETYLLKSADAPIPRNWIFYTFEDCRMWLETAQEFPLVAKLRPGSGSENIKLIRDRGMALDYARKMFGHGVDTTPSVIFKARTQAKSSGDLKTVLKRFKRIPDLWQKQKSARLFPREKGYAYFQEFIPNEGFDLKIVVVGDKLSFIVRKVRAGDFRASGSGSLYFDKTKVTKDIIDSAFRASDRLGFQCMGYDYIVDQREGKGKIVEMSYGFSHSALMGAGGYWDRDMNWHDDALNAPFDVMERLLASRANKLA